MTDQQRFMMATKAQHLTGDISRDEPDLAYIDEEHEDHYVGEWVTGFGFAKVKFPKDTTRELTDEERAKFSQMHVELNGIVSPIGVQPPEEKP